MRAGERRDDLGQRAEVQVQQAADGVMVEEPVPLGGQRAEAGGAFKRLEAGDQPPSAAPVAADDGAARPEPRVVQQLAHDGCGRGSIRDELGDERKDAGAR